MTNGIDYFKDRGYSAVKVNSKKGGGMNQIRSAIQEACKEKTERDRKRGILNRPVRAMVVGHSECREVYVYQFPRGEGMCEDWE